MKDDAQKNGEKVPSKDSPTEDQKHKPWHRHVIALMAAFLGGLIVVFVVVHPTPPVLKDLGLGVGCFLIGLLSLPFEEIFWTRPEKRRAERQREEEQRRHKEEHEKDQGRISCLLDENQKLSQKVSELQVTATRIEDVVVALHVPLVGQGRTYELKSFKEIGVGLDENLDGDSLLKCAQKYPDRAGRLALKLDVENNKWDGVEMLYRCAVRPYWVPSEHLRNFAEFLNRVRQKRELATLFFEWALEAEPLDPGNLSNYGQFLVGDGKPKEGITRLDSAFNISVNIPKDDDKLAELCFALWLALRAWPQDNMSCEKYEKHFKFLIQKEGFTRTYSWNFGGMLARAKEVLPPEDFEYAEALADAFLQEIDARALNESGSRWNARWDRVVAVDPRPQNPTKV